MTRLRRTVSFAILAALTAGAVASAQEVPPTGFVNPPAELKIQANSRIQSVTVFPDRATVVRTTAFRPVLGPQSVVFSGLRRPSSPGPCGRGTGSRRGEDPGTGIGHEFLESPLLPAVAKLQAELDALSYEISRTKTIWPYCPPRRACSCPCPESQSALNAAAVAQVRPTSWAGKRPWNSGGQTGRGEERANRTPESPQGAGKPRPRRSVKRIEEIRPGRPAEALRVTVLIEARTVGDFTLDLSYTVGSARWTPLYTVRALPDTGRGRDSRSPE